MGFVVCFVFQGNMLRITGNTRIQFKVSINGKLNPESEVDYIDTPAADEKSSIWIVYLPFSFYHRQAYDDFEHDDSSLSIKGNLRITISKRRWHEKEIVRCGAHIIYKEDVESMHHVDKCIHDYRNSSIFHSLDGTVTYTENLL